MALKPVPKAILIIAVVSAAGYTFTKFMPKAPADSATTAPAATVVTPPTQDQVNSAAVTETASTPSAPPMTPATDAPRPNVTTGDAGLSAVIGAGR